MTDRAPSSLPRKRGLLPKRHDELGREQGQTIVRVVVLVILLVYLLFNHYPIDFSQGPPGWLVVVLSYLTLSAITMVLALRDTTSSGARRTITNIADVYTISYLLASTGEIGIPFFVLYIWVTLGNGFRFGLTSMIVSAVLSVVGFSVVIALSPLWQHQTMLAIGVFAGLILIPGYTAHLIRQLHQARRHAEEASTAKGQFLARMSHELRTPLNGILGTTDLLSASKRLTREDRALLNVVRDSVKVSIRQIDNVLDFSKIEAGKLSIDITEFDLHELLSRCARMVRSIVLEKSLRLMLRIDPAVPYQLVGDPHHLHEVLLNLLSNAIKFTHEGYVSFEAQLVSKDARSALIRFEVRDTGVGIEPAALSYIFDAFSQEDAGTTRRYGGTGLGTTIAKQLTELMGGQLGVHSIKGEGSTFFTEIRFPLQPQNDTNQSIAGLRVLLISKNASLETRIASFTQDWGVSLIVTPSSEEAVGLLARNIRLGKPIHAVLVDSQAVISPGGVHGAQAFLDKAALSFTPVSLLCDVAPEEEQLRQWGYATALPTDVSPTVLFNVVHAAIRHDLEAENGVLKVEPWAWGKSGGQRPRLLVADDNRTNLMIIKKILETANYEVDTAEDGDQALDMMLQGDYKAAVLDMHMPGIDGIQLIKKYRSIYGGPKIPIVMLTANATVDAQMASADAGADAYLTKPCTAAKVIGTIERLLEETQIYELQRRRPTTPPAQDAPLLNMEVINDIDRLYQNPEGIKQILQEFERECRRLLDNIMAAVTKKNHAAFCDAIHALKGNGANLGAMRLVQTCHEIENCGLIEFRRDGGQMLQTLESAFAETAKALREFTITDQSGKSV